MVLNCLVSVYLMLYCFLFTRIYKQFTALKCYDELTLIQKGKLKSYWERLSVIWFFPCADLEGVGGQGARTPTEKSQKYRASLQYWSDSPVKPHSLQASIQCWAIIGPPVKRHLNGVSLEDRYWPDLSGIWIHSPPKKRKKKQCQSWTPSEKTWEKSIKCKACRVFYRFFATSWINSIIQEHEC